MADRDAVLLPPARDFYNRRTRDEQNAIDLIVADLCVDPTTDGILKFLLDSPPDFPAYYRDQDDIIVYDELNDWTIAIWQIIFNTDETTLIGHRP